MVLSPRELDIDVDIRRCCWPNIRVLVWCWFWKSLSRYRGFVLVTD
jgi:hypothetical protein